MPEVQRFDRRVPKKHVRAYIPLAAEASPKAEATPVKAFLALNITPRSSARKGRAESTTSTPTRTPDISRPSSLLIGNEYAQLSSSQVFPSSSQVAAVGQASTRAGASSNIFPKFFHASEANSVVGSTCPPTSFMYANGELASQIAFPTLLTQSAAPRNPPSIPSDAKIFHANRQSKVEASKPIRPSPRPIASLPSFPSAPSLSQLPSPPLTRCTRTRSVNSEVEISRGQTASSTELDYFFHLAVGTHQVLPQSPTSPLLSPTHSIVDGASAANARRERKVLDLEISNSSLLAINRTLEREMRKQTAELRRYRRLTSAGRISIAPSSRLSGSTVDSEDDLDFSDEASTVSLTSSDRSPSVQASHDARQCERDEKVMQLDLAKHQELLLDSQRLNYSLKRCLGITEELIMEGRKAVEYQVKIGEVELGGRVLASKEVESRRGLLSPAIETGSSSKDEAGFNWQTSGPDEDCN